MGHSCLVHASELSSPAVPAAAGAHSLGTVTWHPIGPSVHVDTNHALTMLTIGSPNTFPYLRQRGSPTVVCIFREDFYFGYLDSDLEFLLSVTADSKGALIIRLCGWQCPNIAIRFHANEIWRNWRDLLSGDLFGHNKLLGLLLINEWCQFQKNLVSLFMNDFWTVLIVLLYPFLSFVFKL